MEEAVEEAVSDDMPDPEVRQVMKEVCLNKMIVLLILSSISVWEQALFQFRTDVQQHEHFRTNIILKTK